MKVLLVAPVQEGSGETITAIHIGEDLQQTGHEIRFLASGFARKFIEPHLPGVTSELGADGGCNFELWCDVITRFAPDAVLFADYPFLFVRNGVAPLGNHPGWAEMLDSYRGCLMTLDHFGFAQEEMGFFFGPPHITAFHCHYFPAIPERMQILLPCPMHEPTDVAGRRGHAFRYWKVLSTISSEARASTRAQYLEHREGLLVFHSVPNWALLSAQMLQLPFYRYLPELLDYYLGDLIPRPTIVSVNNGSLLDPARAPRLRIINVPPLPLDQFEMLLFGSDLNLTENRLSISMGKAVCGFQVCAALVNRQSVVDLVSSPDPVIRRIVSAMERERFGSVYRYEAFPGGMTDLLDQIILYKSNSLTEAFCDVEVFGGERSAGALRQLLTHRSVRADLRRKQEKYVTNLARIPCAAELIEKLLS